MILQSQNQFKLDFIESLPQATSADELMQFVEKSNMPVGYKEKFLSYVAEKGNSILILSDEEKTQDFTNWLDESIKRDINVLVTGNSDEARQKRQLALRGQLLLASNNQGITFEVIMTAEEAANVDPLKYIFLSPTLITTTTDIQEIFDQQILLATRKKLVDQRFLVKSGVVDNHVVKIEAVSPQNVSYSVAVDTTQPLYQPLEFTFTNQQGVSRKVTETLLPEEFGQSQIEPGTGPVSQEELVLEQVSQSNAAARGKAFQAAAEAMSYTIPKVEAMHEIPPFKAASLEIPEETQIPLPNIMAAKARVARKRQSIEEAQVREEARYEEAEEEQRKVLSAQSKEEKTKEPKNKVTQPLVKGLIGGGIIAGTGAVAGGLPLFISMIVNM
ncbi:hypothetical protein KKC94_02205 [Patescibacteria group bacterium]|nr:hypothetical protein [Patescibacteria group bacterium]